MSVWAKPHTNITSNSAQIGALYSAGSAGGSNATVDMQLLLDGDAVNSAISSMVAATNTQNRALFGGGALSYTWRHYCVTWDGVHNTGVSTPNYKLYVDGVLVDEIATNVLLDFTFQGDLGGDGSNTRNMNGWIDQFRMFNRPLTQQEVTDLYNEPVPFSPLDLSPIHWWDFSDTSRLYTDDGITKITADNQTIYRCDDKAGSANMIQTLSSKRPAYRNDAAFAVNGRGVASFDGVDDWLSTTASHAASNYTIFVVSITDDLMVDTEFDYVIDVESGRLVLCNRSNVAQGSTVEYYDSIGWQDTGFTGVTGLQSVTWKLESPAASSVRRNGVELASGMSYSQTAIGGVTSLASRYDGTSSNYSAKRYCEVIWYDTPLNASQILQVEQYLSDKWGV